MAVVTKNAAGDVPKNTAGAEPLADVVYVPVAPRPGNLIARLTRPIGRLLERHTNAPQVRFGADRVVVAYAGGAEREISYEAIERVLMPAFPKPHVEVWVRPRLEALHLGRFYAPAGSGETRLFFGLPQSAIVLDDGTRLPLSLATAPLLEEFKRRLPARAGAPQLARRYFEDVKQLPGAEAWGPRPPAPKSGAKAEKTEEEEDPHAEMAGR